MRTFPLLFLLLSAVLCQAQRLRVGDGTSGMSPYISRVYEFCPAPGQFVNELPQYEPGDDANDIRLKAEDCLKDNERVLVSLGSFGGYVVFGFDHMVENVPGQYDLRVLGNAFFSAANPNKEETRDGGSSEPGIVMVSYDANGNGRPDDEWYELAGSEYYKPETRHHYSVTYYRPEPGHTAVPDTLKRYVADTACIRWRDNLGRTGHISRTVYHTQPFYPEWVSSDSITFTGTCLAPNGVDESGVGTYYVLYCYPWGYADNYPNTHERSCLNLEWAVDSLGRPVQLPGIHFVKVYTGLFQQCGHLGETSTEVVGAEDLHLTTGLRPVVQRPPVCLLGSVVTDRLLVASDAARSLDIYDIQSRRVLTTAIPPGTSAIPFAPFPPGLYLLRTPGTTLRFVKN